jgi:hypothetical protein
MTLEIETRIERQVMLGLTMDWKTEWTLDQSASPCTLRVALAWALEIHRQKQSFWRALAIPESRVPSQWHLVARSVPLEPFALPFQHDVPVSTTLYAFRTTKV